MTYFDTNTWVGWLLYYANHLITTCGIERKYVLRSITMSTHRVMGCERSSDTGALSDNECIMHSNRWLYWVDGNVIYNPVNKTQMCSIAKFFEQLPQ